MTSFGFGLSEIINTSSVINGKNNTNNTYTNHSGKLNKKSTFYVSQEFKMSLIFYELVKFIDKYIIKNNTNFKYFTNFAM